MSSAVVERSDKRGATECGHCLVELFEEVAQSFSDLVVDVATAQYRRDRQSAREDAIERIVVGSSNTDNVGHDC